MSKLPFPERVLHQHIAVLGKTGSGKSSALRVIAEHLLDKKRRICIVDPKGDWWGLKASADGKSAGYPVITFGNFKEPRAVDVPINEASGKHVAELIATGNRPCVIGLRGWMPSQLRQFWLDFAPALFNANEGELYVVIDEVHNFAPKGKIMDPRSGECLHWTNRIMSEGRGLGLTFFVASQRPQKVHNDTLDNCETLIAMRVAHPAARNALKDWIDGNGDPQKGKDVLATLAALKRGEAWVWSPENEFGPARVQFPMFRTFDSFAPPQLQKKVSQAGWSEVDLDQVKQKLATVIAEAKANDPKELKSEIARLKHELARKPAPAPVVTAADRKIAAKAAGASMATLGNQHRIIERMRAEIEAAMKIVARVTAFGFEQTKVNPKQLEQAVQKAIEEIGRSIASATDIRRKEFDQLKREAESLLKRLERVIDRKIDISVDVVRAQPPFVLGPSTQPPRPKPPIQMSAPRIRAREPKTNGKLPRLGGLHQQAAGILAAYYPDPVKTSILAVMCGRTMGGTWSARLSELRAHGLLEDAAAGYVRASDKCAREYAGTFDAPRSTSEVLAIWNPKLGGIHRAMLQFLVEANGEPVTKEQLAQTVNATMGGSFSARLSELRSTGLLTEPGRGMVAANKEALFLDAPS